jgi:hypothetical protein
VDPGCQHAAGVVDGAIEVTEPIDGERNCCRDVALSGRVAGVKTACPPALMMSPQTCAPSSARRPATTTAALSAATREATARPMPEVAPTTSMTLPVS